MASVSLILGGARSGKSRYAEQLATNSKKNVVYLATATAFDSEMHERITHHQQQRNPEWLCVEEPLLLPDAIRQHAADDRCLLIDCLTLWLNNLLFMMPEQTPADHFELLYQSCAEASGEIILVANEIGLGVIPMGEISRQFVDEAGRLNQKMAQLAERVIFIAAGLPLTLKGQHE